MNVLALNVGSGTLRYNAPGQTSSEDAAAPVWVIPVDEERQIAREVSAELRNHL